MFFPLFIRAERYSRTSQQSATPRLDSKPQRASQNDGDKATGAELLIVALVVVVVLRVAGPRNRKGKQRNTSEDGFFSIPKPNKNSSLREHDGTPGAHRGGFDPKTIPPCTGEERNSTELTEGAKG